MDKSTEAYKEYRREIVRKSMRNRRAKAKAAGLCIQCMIVPPMPERTLCQRCMKKQAEASRKYEQGKQPWKYKGGKDDKSN